MQDAAPYSREVLSGFRVQFLRETASTNALALEGTVDCAVYVADVQTAGRGRRATPWHSAPGLGLWMSIAVQRPPQDLGLAAVLAVRAAVAKNLPLGTAPPIAVKWPNDLLAAGRKVCGILVEHRAGWSAVGIGLNLSQAPADFPEDLRAIATSLAAVYGSVPARDEWLRVILEEFRVRMARIEAGDGDAVFEEWRAALALEGRTITRGALTGVVESLDRDGALRVRCQEGLVRVDSGAVEVHEA